jgi:hypothetical protein
MKKLLTAITTAAALTLGAGDLDLIVSGRGPEIVTVDVGAVRSYAFAGCRGVKEIYLPEAVQLGHSAFIGCTALQHVELPKLTSFSTLPGAFAGCPALKHVYLNSIVFPDSGTLPGYPWGARAGTTFHFSNITLVAGGPSHVGK